MIDKIVKLYKLILYKHYISQRYILVFSLYKLFKLLKLKQKKISPKKINFIN